MIKLTLLMTMLTIKMMKMNNMKKKNSINQIECGFNSMMMKKSTPIKFILVLMIFVIFDLEMIILIPSKSSSNKSTMNKTWTIMISMVMMSTMMEMKMKKIKWYK